MSDPWLFYPPSLKAKAMRWSEPYSRRDHPYCLMGPNIGTRRFYQFRLNAAGLGEERLAA